MAPSRPSNPPARRHSTYSQTFLERASLPNTSPLASYLYRLMAAKNTNLCLSADVQSTSELLELAEECGDSICVLKTHCDIIYDFSDRTIHGLLEISARKRFLIFEDRKFGDIGNTVQTQYAAGTHRIASWAGITNAHIYPGPAIITALQQAAERAISVSNYSNSTAIFGGGDDRNGFFPPGAVHKSEDDASDDDDAEDDDGDAEDEAESSDDEGPASSLGPPSSQSGNQAERKTSVISISTTISSTTEYISPQSSLPLSSSLAQRSSHSSTSANYSSQHDPGDHPPMARGLLLLAQMSSKDNLFTPAYTAKCVELARQHRDFVMGFVAQSALNTEPGDNFIVMTPGVALAPIPSLSGEVPAERGSRARADGSSLGRTAITAQGDALGQQYRAPRSVVLEGVDIIIVGRAILNSDDREGEAERYREEGWTAIVERTGRRR